MTRSTRGCRRIRRSSVYLTSGGRLLLTPPITILAALGLMVLARIDGAAVSIKSALAITVHASVVLALQQVVATPLHYVQESLTSPTTVAGLLRTFDEGSWPARLFGTIDVFGLWWIWLLSVGLAAATGNPARRYLMAAAGRLCGSGGNRRRGIRGVWQQLDLPDGPMA